MLILENEVSSDMLF